MHTDNRKNDILVLSEGPAHGLDDCAITAEDTVISLNPKKFFIWIYTALQPTVFWMLIV